MSIVLYRLALFKKMANGKISKGSFSSQSRRLQEFSVERFSLASKLFLAPEKLISRFKEEMMLPCWTICQKYQVDGSCIANLRTRGPT